MKNANLKSIVVAIDTDKYSGNFEREMCAFVTGQIGECSVGQRLAGQALEELPEHVLDWIEEHIERLPDDNGCYRPCYIWPTPGRVNNGSGVHFNEADISPEDCWAGIHWPAYESVAIFFDEVPPAEVIDTLIVRVKLFAQSRLDHYSYMGEIKPLTINSVRILKPVKIDKNEFEEVAKYEV